MRTPTSPMSNRPSHPSLHPSTQNIHSPHPYPVQSPPSLSSQPLPGQTQSPPPDHPFPPHSNHSTTSTSTFVDPPPLDEKVARYCMSVMVLFIKQTSSWGDRPKASGHIHTDTLYDFETIESPHQVRTGRTFSSSNSTGSGGGLTSPSATVHRRPGTSRRTTSIGNPLAIAGLSIGTTPSYGAAFTPNHPSKFVSFNSPILASTIASVNALISKYIHKIIFFVSASNWNVVFSRIRQKIHWFASGSELTDGNSGGDNTDMKLLGFCCLDQGRLIQLFQELSSLLVSMKREAQSSIALSLRNAIWNWITCFPEQFTDVIRSNSSAESTTAGSRIGTSKGVLAGFSGRRLEGAPERVFDTLYGMMQDPGSLNTNRRIIWPTLAALLAVSPERLRQSEVALAGVVSSGKKVM